MRKHNHNRDPSSSDENPPAKLEELTGLADQAAILWSNVAKAHELGRNGVIPGFKTSFIGNKARITKQFSPSIAQSITLYKNEEDVWQIEQERYRPGSEHEAHGSVLRQVTLNALAPGQPTFYTQEVCQQQNDGELVTVQVIESDIKPPMDSTTCAMLSSTLHGLVNTQWAVA